MKKVDLRHQITAATCIGNIIIPKIMTMLHAKSKGLDMSIVKRSTFEAEITAIDKEKREWRYPVNLQTRSFSCRKWQITREPCIHAMYFITLIRGPVSEIGQYVHQYFFVAKLNATYDDDLPILEGKQQWDVVDP